MKKAKTGKTAKTTEEGGTKIARRVRTKEKPSIVRKAEATENPVTAGPRISISAEKQRTQPRGIRKAYTKSHKVCSATFGLPMEAAPNALKVTIVGDFNNWDKEANPLKKLKTGDFTVTLRLDPGKEYRFRYLIDGKIWENDWCADKYVKSPYGVEDSVVCA